MITNIVLFPVEFFERSDAERIEDMTLKNLTEFVDVMESYHGNKKDNILVSSLTDFMDDFNDEELNDDKYWFTYINLTY